GTTAGVRISGVAGVTFRGFRLNGLAVERAAIQMDTGAVGTVLEDLYLDMPTRDRRSAGILVLGTTSEASAATVVRRCQFHSGFVAVELVGRGTPCADVVLRDNLIADGGRGIEALGLLSRLQVVGNRFRGCQLGGVTLESLDPATEALLI